MGRWSTIITEKFLAWLNIPPAQNWLDVGCGTGALTKVIFDQYQPLRIFAIDPSKEFIDHAQQSLTDPTVLFKVGSAQSLDIKSNSIDAVVSGLALNFVPQPEEAVSEMVRVTKPGGKIGVFLWDYADRMEMLRYFWDAARELDASAKELDEGVRFPLCQEELLDSLVRDAGLKQVELIPIEISTEFQNFDDYWTPFLGNVGPAPNYNMSLNHEDRQKLENPLRERLPFNHDGSISLIARAWAVKGVV